MPDVPLATIAVIIVSARMVYDDTGIPPTDTPVTFVKPAPLIVRKVPAPPPAGLKDDGFGKTGTKKD